MSEESREAARLATSAYIDAEPSELQDIPIAFVAAFKRGYAAGQSSRTPPPATKEVIDHMRGNLEMAGVAEYIIGEEHARKILAEWPEDSRSRPEAAGEGNDG